MDEQLIIIIGLPGSGKTTYAKGLLSYKMFDDFMKDFYNGEVLKLLKNKEKVCLNDPRLCDINHFNRYEKIFLNHIPKENIHLILFENNPAQCLKNITDRNDGRKGISEWITPLSAMYNLDNYKEYKHTVMSVYKSVIN